MAYWHALAKMRLHTDTSLALLDKSTTVLGQGLRHFTSVTCAAFETKETQSEYQARARAAAARRAAQPAGKSAITPIGGRRQRGYNMKVIKLHFLGDYVHFIRRKGTTDSYTTQIVSAMWSMR